MDAEKQNNALYEKMSAEQRIYREWLLSLPAQEILDHAYEYTIREDILIAMEEDILSEEEVQALLQSPALWLMCIRTGRNGTTAATWTPSGM